MNLLCFLLLFFGDTAGRRNPLHPQRCVLVGSFSLDKERIVSLALAPGGQLGAGGRRDGGLVLFEVGTGRVLRTYSGHRGYVYSIEFLPDGRTFISAGMDGTLRMWSVQDGLVATLKGRDSSHFSVSVGGRGRWAVSVGGEGLSIWNLARRRCERTIRLSEGTVAAMRGDVVAGADYRGTVRVWHRSGRLLHVMPGAGKAVLTLSFSPSGRDLAAGGHDGVIRLWRLPAGTLLHRLRVGSGYVEALAFSSDGRYLASAGREIRIWEVTTGEPVRTIDVSARAYTVGFARHGTSILASCEDNRLRLWGPSSSSVGRKETSGPREKGFLGVSYRNQNGAFVLSVVEKSQAERTGFQPSDVILGADDRRFKSSDDFLEFMRETFEGQEVWLRVKREEKERLLKVKLGRWP